MKIKEALSEILFPSNIYCICCGSIIDKTRVYGLCDNCMEHFHWITGKTCIRCGKALNDRYFNDLCYDCREWDHSFERGIACVEYGLFERAVLMDLKYADKPWIGRFLGKIMFDRLKYMKETGELEPDYNFDVIVPVPIHKKRRAVRGYNQSEIMAFELGKLCERSVRCSALVRSRNTAAMKGLDIAGRRSNVAGAFKVPAGREFFVDKKHVLLIDDIFTTGSTMDECASALLAAGAAKVDFMCFAAGANRPPAID